MSTRSLQNAGVNAILGVLLAVAVLGVASVFAPAKAGPFEDAFNTERAAGCVKWDTLVGYYAEPPVYGVTMLDENAARLVAMTLELPAARVNEVTRAMLVTPPAESPELPSYGFEAGGCVWGPFVAPEGRDA